MCGIITIIRKDKKKAVKQLLKGYENQKYRGQEGYGFISFDNGKMINLTRTEHEKDIKERLKKETAMGIFFHHRTPTSTPNYKELTHPILVSNIKLKYDYYVIHNGIIENDKELRTRHESEGYTYTTICKKIYETNTTRYTTEQFNDSESLAIELAKAIDENKNGIQDVKGSIAFMVLQIKKHSDNINAIYYGRNIGSPLRFAKAKEYIRVASEGSGETIDTDELYKIDLKDNKITSRTFICGSYAYTNLFDDERDYPNRYTATRGQRKLSDLLESDFEVDRGLKDIDEMYMDLPKNPSGYVWLTGNETYDELAMLWSQYDFEIEKANQSGTIDKQEEYQMKLNEVEDMLEFNEYNKGYEKDREIDEDKEVLLDNNY